MTTDQEVIDNRLDLEMLERPHLWPQQCPVQMVYVKRPVAGSSWPQVGRCIRTKNGGYMIRSDFDNDSPNTFEYADARAVLTAGWVVD